MKRRRFILLMAAAPLVMTITGGARSADKSLDSIRKNWKSLLARDAKVSLSTEPLRKSKAEWKQSLSDAPFYVLRAEGTERPFSSPLNDEKRRGGDVWAGCALPLFTSQMKFDSGTGGG